MAPAHNLIQPPAMLATDRGVKPSRSSRRPLLRPIPLAVILLYGWLSAFALLCNVQPGAGADHTTGAPHHHQDGLHRICTWAQEVASAHLTSKGYGFPLLGTLLLSLAPVVLPFVDPIFRPRSIRAPPLCLL